LSQITTHVLDTSIGKPGQNIAVNLEHSLTGHEGSWVTISQGLTNGDGRVPELLPKSHSLQAGVYRITFELKKYFADQGRSGFYPYASVVFDIENTSQHYHVPLLLSGYGYSTYRGS
jgi:5-hydroxyisourate hydrolase